MACSWWKYQLIFRLDHVSNPYLDIHELFAMIAEIQGCKTFNFFLYFFFNFILIFYRVIFLVKGSVRYFVKSDDKTISC